MKYLLITLLTLLTGLSQAQSITDVFMKHNNITWAPIGFYTCIDNSTGEFNKTRDCVYKYVGKFKYTDNGVKLLKTYKKDIIFQLSSSLVNAGVMELSEAEIYIECQIDKLILDNHGISYLLDKKYAASKLGKRLMSECL